MFNTLKIILAFALTLAIAPSKAQSISDPTTWTYELKKKSGDLYELVFHLKLKEGWHIWSIKPGGDGSQIPPSFTIDQNDKVQLDGQTIEFGKKISEEMVGVEGVLNYFSNKVDYIQLVYIKGKTKITGKHEYQVCNDNLCLPPKTLKFTVNLTK
jgi:DsbC/DsbD-like thiol-disulfide interchange protein